MQLSRALLAVLVLAASVARAEEPATETPADKPKTRILSEKEMVDDDGYVARLSLPTESDLAQWKEPGLRIGLAYAYGHEWGTGPALDLATHAFTIRALTRIDSIWSVGVDFQYALATGSRMTGLRYAGTVQALANVWKELTLSVGLGLGGLVLQPPRGTPTPKPPGNGEEVSNVTFGADATLGTCSGSSWLGTTRAEYQFVAGPLFASGPYVEVNSQFTRCQQTIGRIDRETGGPIFARQWWRHTGGAAGWWFTWR